MDEQVGIVKTTRASLLWLHATVSGIVDDPAAVFIESKIRDNVVEFGLRVAPEDIGKIIGKAGRTARSLRTIFFAMGRKNGTRYELDILERGVPGDTSGQCVHCGCTYTTPCMDAKTQGTCAWANEEHTLCTNPECLAKERGAVIVAGQVS